MIAELYHRARLALLQRICGYAGHNPSWVQALARGYLDRPVCADCGAVLPRQRVPPGVKR